MGSLRTFEIKLSKEAKERKKIVGLRAESKFPNEEGDDFLDQWPYYLRILKEP